MIERNSQHPVGPVRNQGTDLVLYSLAPRSGPLHAFSQRCLRSTSTVLRDSSLRSQDSSGFPLFWDHVSHSVMISFHGSPSTPTSWPLLTTPRIDRLQEQAILQSSPKFGANFHAACGSRIKRIDWPSHAWRCIIITHMALEPHVRSLRPALLPCDLVLH